jgi:multidrug efflux pump subunit AcrA (membrane-fusion protein)
MDLPRASTHDATRRFLPALGVVLAIALTVAVTCFGRSIEAVDQSGVTIDTVKHGWFVREVRAPGSLVPEQVRWISALSAGRVERVHVVPGTRTEAGAVLLEMTNPDVRLEVLEAERQLSAAEAALVSLQASLQTQRLAQAGVVASVRSQQREAARQAAAKAELAAKQLITRLDAEYAADHAEEMVGRLAIEEESLRILTRSTGAQMNVQRAEIQRLQEIAAFQRARFDALTVRSPLAGVIQEIPSETGQWINPGQTLVKLHATDKLKATLRVPAIDARDVAPGQSVAVDTRNGIVQGRVTRVSPAVQGGVVLADVALPALPAGARPDLSVDGVIEVERRPTTLHVARMPGAEAEQTAFVYKVTKDGKEAVRTAVQIGHASATRVEIRSGLARGDVVITSALPISDQTERIRLRN